MPPRVTYWTGTWDPAKEAISKEIEALRHGARSRAPVVSFSPGQTTAMRLRDRVLLLSGRAWPVLRGVAPFVERLGDVTHVFGGRGVSWHLMRAIGRRPVLLTAVSPNPEPPGGLPATRFARVVIETETNLAEWLAEGIGRERIEIVRPGIDLTWHAPAPRPSGRLTLLFASTPPDAAEIAARGIPMLAGLARARPDIDILLPWREWGDMEAARRAIAALEAPPNFRVEFGNVRDMRPYYARAHATIVCFERGAGKGSPNFVIEGLAAGRPSVATTGVGLASEIERAGAGVVVLREIAALSAAVDRIQSEWEGLSSRARRLAETEFDLDRFRSDYDRIYNDLAAQARAGIRP